MMNRNILKFRFRYKRLAVKLRRKIFVNGEI